MKRIVSIVLMIVFTLGLFASCDETKREEKESTTGEQTETSVEGDAKIIDIPLTKAVDYMIGVKKSNTALLQQINDYLAQIKNDGSLDEIICRYYSDKEANAVASAEEAEGKNQFVVATDARDPAFEKKSGDGFVGIDMELAKGLAAHLGKELVIKDVNADSFAQLLEDSTADAVISRLTKTDENKELMAFSSSYFSAKQVLIVAADDVRFDACTSADEIEEILAAFTTDQKIGVQKYSYAQDYVIGSEEKELDGFDAECYPLPNCKYAVENLLLGEVECVIADESAAQPVLNSFQ